MYQVLLLGCGKIGRTIARLLSASGDYQVRVGDSDAQTLERLRQATDIETQVLDASDPRALRSAAKGCQSIISALSYEFSGSVAEIALECGASYFDLTEDVQTAQGIRRSAASAAAGQVFMPQCGLAPGFVSILASHLARPYHELDAVRMRVGALPQFPTNALNYNLTWSTDGLINEYCNPCDAIHQKRRIEALPLEGLETFSLDGVRYEAFNTSGGIGTLCETLEDRVWELNYRTIRYPGHRDLMSLLLHDLRLSRRRGVLKDILERAIPVTFQDVVIVFCTVTGWQDGQFVQTSDARKFYCRTEAGQPVSAIQLTTAWGLCAVLDLHRTGRLPSSGFVKQEDVDFQDFIGNRYGSFFQTYAVTGSAPPVSEATGDDHGAPASRDSQPASRPH